VNEGRPNIVDLVKTGKIDLRSTHRWARIVYDEKSIRRAAIRYNIPCIDAGRGACGCARDRVLHEQEQKSPRCRICTAVAAASGVPAGD
jgi:hypothetical protein